MKSIRGLNSLLVLGSVLLLAACAGQTPDRSDAVGEQLHQLFADDWERGLRDSPETASYYGDKRFNAKLDDISLAAIDARHQQDKQILKRLHAIDRNSLTDEDKLNYDLFEQQYKKAIERHQFRSYLIPLNQRGGIQTKDSFSNYISLQSVQDYEDWLARLDKLPVQLDQTVELMKEGIKTGVMPPRATMERVPAQIEKQLVSNPVESLFYKAFESMPGSISAPEQARLQASAQQVIAEKLVPAYRQFKSFFVEQYLPACRDSHGVWDLPNGKTFYEHLARSFTTTDMTPEEIHQIGLREVARNRAEMDKVIEEVGFEGSFDEFVHFLRTDPQFYYQTPEALYEGYLAVSKRLDPELVKLFGKLPRMPYGVKPIPDAIAPDTTTAYYNTPAADGSRPGYYFVNLYAPETRPKYEMEVLSVHEAVPGHHLQLALQQELGELPNFRRYNGFTVYVEGWGLYSERLGYDMGLYADPYSRFGQLTYDMWRAVRLVVDTGIHYMGWTREQAIDYFKANAAKSEADIVNEIDRYISMPGQALAYKIGQLKIIELREKAETQLGDKFDIRAFHDTVLGQGSVPLDVLEGIVERWIASRQG